MINSFCNSGKLLIQFNLVCVICVARLSGDTVDAMEELDASSAEDKGFLSTRLNQIKRWFLSHAQYLNFFTILILASVSCLPALTPYSIDVHFCTTASVT